MNLHKNGHTDKNQCHAHKKSGERCTRAVDGSGRFCWQHKELLQEALHQHKGGLLDYIPEAPPVLTEMAAGFWRQYCETLLDYNKLRGVYLHEMFELCWRHDYRNIIEQAIDTYGRVNEFDGNIQLNGLDGLLEKNDKRITDLKKMFGLTLDTASKLENGKSYKTRPKGKSEDTSNKKKGMKLVGDKQF